MARQFLTILPTLWLIWSCTGDMIQRNASTLSPSANHLSQLTLEQQPCYTHNSQRIQAVKNILPSGMLVGFDSQELENAAYQALAGIPDVHLEKLKWAYETNSFQIKAESPGFSGGMCAMGNPPDWIQVYPDAYVVAYALQHESGHAMEFMVATDDNFSQELQTVADNNSNNSNLSQYAKGYVGNGDTYYREFFAEAFNSYYCSPDTNVEIKRDFPDAHAFLSKYLAKPVWDDGSNNSQTGGTDDNVKGLFVALDPNDLVWVTTNSKDITEIALCLGDLETCKNSMQKDMTFSLFEAKTSGRTFYKGSKLNNIEDGLAVTILGLNNNMLKESRAVMIQTK